MRKAMWDSWYEKNKERIRDKAKRYHHEHKARRSDAYRAWYVKNRAYSLAKKRAWEKAHPYAQKEWHSTRRARIKNARTGSIDYVAILGRDCGLCGLCQRPVAPHDLSFDHIMPLARGGAHSMENLQVAHVLCNTKKGVKVAS